jgi:MoxR-like ATPase
MNGIENMSTADYSAALYAALSKRQAVAEARRRGWTGDDARAGKSTLCDWLAEHIQADQRAAVLNGATAENAPAGEQPTAPMPEADRTKRATFAGRCKACGDRIDIGDNIGKRSDAWVHLRCAIDPAAPKAEQPAPMTATEVMARQRAHAKPAADNSSEVARAIADALRSLNVSAGIDADAVRGIVREEMATVAPREVVVKVGDSPAVKVDGRPHPMFDKVVKLVAAGVNVLLVGPAGCGKSHLAKQVAQALGRNFGTLHCSAGASESQVTGWLLPIGKGGAFEFKPAHFATLYSEGNSLFLIDEIDAADPNMLMVLNGALANGALHIPQCADRPEWERGKDAAIIAAANTYGHGADAVYAGRNQLDAATLDRFYVVEMGYDTALEKDIGATQPEFYRWHSALREKANANKLRRVVSTRVLQKGVAALSAGIALSQVKADLLAGWTRDERNKVGE